MDAQIIKMDNSIQDLRERAKELNCLYEVHKLLNGDNNDHLDELLQNIVTIVPLGLQYQELCRVKIEYKDKKYMLPGFKETPWVQIADINVLGKNVGKMTVSYLKEIRKTRGVCFPQEEKQLIQTIARWLSEKISYQEMQQLLYEQVDIKENVVKGRVRKYQEILDKIWNSDRNLFLYVTQKILYTLCLNGVADAYILLEEFFRRKKTYNDAIAYVNRRLNHRETSEKIFDLIDDILQIAVINMSEVQIISNITKCIQENKFKYLVEIINNPNSSLPNIINAIKQYRYNEVEGMELTPSIKKSLQVSLICRFFCNKLEYINAAKNRIDIHDYYDLVDRIIFPVDSHGSLGGKSAGLFIANRILAKSEKLSELGIIKTPKTWYITSDGFTNFLFYNNLEWVREQKYKDIEEVRLEYPSIVQIFKKSSFPPKIIEGLSLAIDDIKDHPIIIRSSSLLEDRSGAVFPGKYKSIFLANQGSKEERLSALMSAVAEVYASTFAPDPIEYRAEHGLLDFLEEMAVMIQEVVGTNIGNYFFPAFAGVAFSNNEFCWSPRIQREDGLIRMAPGLGTRVVNRVGDDYPTLIAPGKPDLRANTTPYEILRYSTKKIDVINLEQNRLKTIEISTLMKNFGPEIPSVQHIVSSYEDNMIRHPSSIYNINFDNDNLVITFEGLLKRTPFIKQIKTILSILQEKMGIPINIEFAHDGQHLYLLQCRPQSYAKDSLPSPIPKDIPNDRIIFSADRYISNGFVPDVIFIVYVNPEAYSRLSDLTELTKVGRVVGKLNKILPKRQFILMGPGRWGCQCDVKLGVNVNYCDINNTAMLVEIAREKGNYTPELSFGTHFFQDLVESSIRYLPLYPDEGDQLFNERFLLESKNSLPDLCPEFSSLSETIRVINVPEVTEGFILRILMNAEIGEALGFLETQTADTSH